MKFYEGNSLPERVHSNCSVSDSPVAAGPAQVPMPRRAGDGAFLSLDLASVQVSRAVGRQGEPSMLLLPQARWWACRL